MLKIRRNTSINIKVILEVLMCILFFNPQYINKMSNLDNVLDVLKILLACFLLFIYMKNNKMSKTIFIVVCLVVISILNTLFWGSPLKTTMNRYVPILAIMFWLSNNKERIWEKIYNIFFAAEVLIIINFISMILFPEGIYIGENKAAYWIIGQKQEFANVYIIVIIIAALIWENKKQRKNIVAIFLMIFYSVVKTLPLGFLIYTIIFCSMLYILRKSKFKIKARSIFFITILLNAFVIFFAFQYDKFSKFLFFLNSIKVGHLSKAETLIVRAAIWKDAILILKNSLFMGVGTITENIYYSFARYAKYHPHFHNMFLDIAVTGGIVGVIMFILINYYALNRLNTTNCRIKNVLLCGIFSMNIYFLSDCFYGAFVFVIYFLASEIESLEFARNKKL